MNLLIKNSKDLLPQEKRILIEHKQKLFKSKTRVFFVVGIFSLLAISLILFPQIIRGASRYVAPIYTNAVQDPIITQTFEVKRLNQQDAIIALNDNHIDSAQIASQTQLAELIVKPSVNEQSVETADARVLLLHKYLVDHGSPMSGSASTFIAAADKNKIDWRLLPAIANTESGLGRIIPIKANGALSYNPFGFGVYGGTFLSFSSWDNAIQTVADKLTEAYGAANMKPGIMEETYCPPCYAGDHHWVRNTLTTMADISSWK